MAFYPDELSPIDRLSTLQTTNDLSDINLLKNRRQWKSLVLGKKEMGLNNFATITEEKEDEISSDESLNAKKLSSNILKSNSEGSAKKITFPKPRKYITPRIPDKFNNNESFGPSLSSNKSSIGNSDKTDKKEITYELHHPLNIFKGNKPSEAKHVLKTKKSQDIITPKKEIIEHYVLSNIPSETQWNKISESVCLTGWPKMKTNKNGPSKSSQSSKLKVEDKKKTGEINIKLSVGIDKGKHDSKSVNKKSSKKKKNVKALNEKENTIEKMSPNLGVNKIKPKVEKDESLNMKEVVNMYKNLAYGSKDEIKSFVEKLSFVKNDSENDKNLLSVMNLKALEHKIKNFGKKSEKPQTSVPEEKKIKMNKNVKKSKKVHIEKLARHKIKVPAASNSHYLKLPPNRSFTNEKKSEQKVKKQVTEDKEPWKYVGMNSILNKDYIVYPAYQPSSSPTKIKKKKERAAVGAGEDKSKKDDANPGKPKSLNVSQQRPKVKHPEIVIRSKAGRDCNKRSRTTSLANALRVCRSMSDKKLNRFSATTVCTIKFRPSITQTTHNQFSSNESEPTDPSLLVYLHGSKAVNVKTPYSDRQFSRVKFFRNNERGIPLIKGFSRKSLAPINQNFPVKKISLPEKFSSFRSLDLLNFDEDIQNITDFLHSQTNLNPEQLEGSRSLRKRRHLLPIEWPREEDLVGVQTKKHLNRQIRNQDQQHDSRHHHHQNSRHLHTNQYNHHNLHHHHHHHYQHGTEPEALSPDSFFNEISKHIQQLQYLPDTEESRKLISQFFDELNHRIEASTDGQLFLQQLPPLDNSHCLIPILGY